MIRRYKYWFIFSFATNRRWRILILKYNSEIGPAIIAKIDAIIEDVPPTSPNKSKRP
jgi:hypothetical protein